MKELYESLRRYRPRRLDVFWTGSFRTEEHIMALQHSHAQFLNVWCPSEEIQEVLENQTSLVILRDKLACALLHTGMICEQSFDSSDKTCRYSSCCGCNTPYDAGGGCSHDHTPPHVPIFTVNPLSGLLHTSVVLVSITLELLVHKSAEPYFVKTLIEPPTDRAMVLPCLVGILDNSSNALPKLAHLSAGLLSLLMAKAPSLVLTIIDGDMFIPAMIRYLDHVINLLEPRVCIVEEHFSVVALLNSIPFLYGLARWKPGQRALQEQLAKHLLEHLINLCYSALQADSERVDGPIENLKRELPELATAKMWILPILDEYEQSTPVKWRSALFQQHPISFAVAVVTETLAAWSFHSKKNILDRAGVFNLGRRSGVPACEVLEIHIPKIRELAKKAPQLEYAAQLATEISQGKIPALPKEEGVLQLPMEAYSARCLLCRAKRNNTDGGPLHTCSGCRMASYCSVTCQRQHWAQHKLFCKQNQ